MHVEVIEEAGFASALLGISLSYKTGKPDKKVADRLAFKQGGHNKFLESMIAWLDVTAPRYWWSQFDTYRVGTSKQSESTMHTLMSGTLSQEDFQGGCDRSILEVLNKNISKRDFIFVKAHLPESYLQRRIICTNYKVLQHIVAQRSSHRLPEWQLFIEGILAQLKYPSYIKKM